MKNLSVVILAKNEEGNIKSAIKSVDFADEIIVIDDNSTDNTGKIAAKAKANVYVHSLENNWAQQRNYGLKKAKGKWVLFLDADERITKELKNEIIQAIEDPFIRTEAFYFKRRDFLWGKELKHGETANVRLVRMARPGVGKWVRHVHEEWKVLGRKKEFKYPIYHYPHETVGEFLSSIRRMSLLHAEANREEGKKSSLFKIIFWPKAHFFKNWILNLGFLDGTEGFIVSLMMSFHSFLAWSNLWILQRDSKKK